MSDIINMKDFFNHDTRITLLENAVINIDKRFEQIDKRFEQVDRRFEQVDKRIESLESCMDKRFEKLETKMDSQFKWIIGCIGGLGLTTISALITVITIIGKHS